MLKQILKQKNRSTFGGIINNFYHGNCYRMMVSSWLSCCVNICSDQANNHLWLNDVKKLASLAVVGQLVAPVFKGRDFLMIASAYTFSF